MKRTPFVFAFLVACKNASPTPNPTPAASSSAAGQGNHYIVDTSAPTCSPDADCALVARITAQDGFHVNKEYPYKLAMNAAPGVTFLAPGAISSRATGDFKEEGELAGAMTVRFRATAGAHPLSGTFKISVCNASSCLMEQSTIAATVTAK